MGMYYIEGMPESSYHKAKALNKKWVQSGRGEIRVVRSMKYHGKLYLFSKDGLPVGAIDGSANLGVISSDANNLRQYEVATLIESQLELSLIRALIDDIVNRSSVNIDEVDDMKIIRENNSYIGESDSAEKYQKRMWMHTRTIQQMFLSPCLLKFRQRQSGVPVRDTL